MLVHQVVTDDAHASWSAFRTWISHVRFFKLLIPAPLKSRAQLDNEMERGVPEAIPPPVMILCYFFNYVKVLIDY